MKLRNGSLLNRNQADLETNASRSDWIYRRAILPVPKAIKSSTDQRFYLFKSANRSGCMSNKSLTEFSVIQTNWII